MTGVELIALWEDLRKKHGGDAASEGIARLLEALRKHREAGGPEVEDPTDFAKRAAVAFSRHDQEQRLMLQGLCLRCCRPVGEPMTLRCTECRDKDAAYQRRRHAERKDRGA